MKKKELTSKLLEIEYISNNILVLRDKLITDTQNKENLVRSDSIDTLSRLLSFNIKKLIKNALNNSDDLTKISIIEFVESTNNNKNLKYILNLLDSKDVLVRAYVYEAIGNLKAKKYLPVLKKAVKSIKTDTEKSRVYYAMYKFGCKSYLKKLIKLLSSNEYQVRCASANLLYYLADSKNKKVILKSLEKTLKKEKTIAVTSTVNSVINDLNKYFDKKSSK